MTIAKNIDPNDIVRLHSEGLSTAQIASALGIKAPTVSYWKKKLGITLVDTKKDWAKIQEAHDAGASYSVLGKQFGVTKRALQLARKRGDFKVHEIPRVTKEHKRGIQRECWARYNAKKSIILHMTKTFR
jgi:transposase-like protein